VRPSMSWTPVARVPENRIFATGGEVQMVRLSGLFCKLAVALVVRYPLFAATGGIPMPIGFPELGSRFVGI